MPAVVEKLCYCYCQLGQEDKLIEYLKECLQAYPKVNLITGIMFYSRKNKNCQFLNNFINQQLASSSSLQGLDYQLESHMQQVEKNNIQPLASIRDCLTKLLNAKPTYQCTQCGFSAKTLYWLCPSCHYWSTIKPVTLFDID